MDGGKYRIAYSPSENEEVRKVAKKAARRLAVRESTDYVRRGWFR